METETRSDRNNNLHNNCFSTSQALQASAKTKLSLGVKRLTSSAQHLLIKDWPHTLDSATRIHRGCREKKREVCMKDEERNKIVSPQRPAMEQIIVITSVQLFQAVPSVCRLSFSFKPDKAKEKIIANKSNRYLLLSSSPPTGDNKFANGAVARLAHLLHVSLRWLHFFNTRWRRECRRRKKSLPLSFVRSENDEGDGAD